MHFIRKSKGKAEVPVLMFVVGLAVFLVGGFVTVTKDFTPPSVAIITTPTYEPKKQSLQLQIIPLITVAPTVPQQPSLCQQGGANNEPEILVGYSPGQGQTVSAGGQIKVWVNDEGAPIVGPDAHVNPSTGQVTSVGNPPAKAPDNYLWEPALYIAPQTAESGGTPHFPTYIKGDYNNNTSKGSGTNVPGMDPPPPGSHLAEPYTGEDIWDVNSLGLGPGTYLAEFVIHDGDEDRGVGCVTITIQ